MALFKWIFGTKEKIHGKLLTSELKDESELFILYTDFFNEKKKHLKK